MLVCGSTLAWSQNPSPLRHRFSSFEVIQHDNDNNNSNYHQRVFSGAIERNALSIAIDSSRAMT